MKMEISRNRMNDEIVVSLSTEDMRNRLLPAVFDMIVVRLADKYMQEFGEKIINEDIKFSELKKDVEDLIKIRLANESK